ncbi:lipid-A-disaccharide synthase [Aquibium sp. A9E412]|uniref:lipid-A-disaccharide synthase n=1 Tax=Aquibium sp. A9E412 TaxID=2976767 RepID=UPI0025B0D482|nr:lipid-A-disaccharide synthase [Aquibium sp. A9E412]MDN2564699.1 lipid-A-disaccharide synthase [Aquibium sp. A9E412]
MAEPLRIAVVAGEESGDLLGADLVEALARASGRDVALAGVGGDHLQALGLASLFPAGDIALMGVTAVVRDLPRLVRRIGETAEAVVRARPDCLVTIDSPAFGLRVAKKVRAADPSIPIVHYVCPSVWAWAPGRAPKMRPHVDDVLCLLPFEPEALARLGGPPGTFVGHRLSRDERLQAAARAQRERTVPPADAPKTLLVLPGSRRSEVRSLAGPFGEVIALLAGRGHAFEVVLPTVPHVAAEVERLTAGWLRRPRILAGPADKYAAFGAADAALACSGTVTLELALAGVPLTAAYRTDPLWGALSRLITTWSASLPNLIADWPIVPEHYNQFLRPNILVREIEQLWADTPMRRMQKAGFAAVARALATARPTGALAADVVLSRIAAGPQR